MPKWSENEVEYLLDNVGFSSYEKIGQKLGRNFSQVVQKAQSMGVYISKSLHKHDFITRSEFMREAVETGLVRPWIISHLLQKGLIKSKKHKKMVLIHLNEYEKWKKFFQKNILAWDASDEFKKKDHDYAHTILYHWHERGILKAERLPGRRSCSIWFNRQSLKECTDIALSTLIISDIARKFNTNVDKVNRIIKKKNIPVISFARRRRVDKKYLSEIKAGV